LNKKIKLIDIMQHHSEIRLLSTKTQCGPSLLTCPRRRLAEHCQPAGHIGRNRLRDHFACVTGWRAWLTVPAGLRAHRARWRRGARRTRAREFMVPEKAEKSSEATTEKRVAPSDPSLIKPSGQIQEVSPDKQS
jgi:hypothetical protein